MSIKSLPQDTPAAELIGGCFCMVLVYHPERDMDRGDVLSRVLEMQQLIVKEDVRPEPLKNPLLLDSTEKERLIDESHPSCEAW